MAVTLLITGTDSGLGLLTAQTLANAGHIVYGGVLSARKSEERGIRDVVLEITDEQSISAAVEKVLSEVG